MTDKPTEALKLALEALETLMLERGSIYENAITAIREALADSALDRMADNARELGLDYEPPCKTGSQCTSKCQQCEQPASKPWVGLTNQELIDLTAIYSGAPLYCAIEAKLKEKNT